ncbi:MAG: hypothetical protein KDA51_06385 [Planctomycetales bacterium]|nr:hypothetical protein [Planctomycetales bacterium]MCA9214634.1 hypothetical protein [Planctomycetales bacterium]
MQIAGVRISSIPQASQTSIHGSDAITRPNVSEPADDSRRLDPSKVEQTNETRKATRSELTPQEEKQVDKLKARDREVRSHEAAHKAAAGSYARSGPHFEFQTGPDGRKYAIGGHVSIDVSPVRDDPEATIQKMQIVRRAALSPAEPSSQDRQVAAQANREIQKAQATMTQEGYAYGDSEFADDHLRGAKHGSVDVVA